MGEVKVLGAPGQVAHHLGDVGQPLVLDKIYAEKIESVNVTMQLLMKSEAVLTKKGFIVVNPTELFWSSAWNIKLD